MAFSGVNVSEILDALRKAKELYDCFTDEFDSAQNRVGELFETFHFLSSTFEEYKALLEQCNKTYPGQGTLLRKLKELEAFILKYSTLVPDRDGTRPLSKPRRIWQTTRFAFDVHMEKLDEGLKMEMQKLALSMGLLALHTNVPAITTNTFNLYQNPSIANVEDFIRILRIAKNRYEREMSEAAQRGREAYTRPIEEEVEDAVRSLCFGIGLSESYAPLLSGRELLRSQSWNGLMVNMTHPSLHNPTRLDPDFLRRRLSFEHALEEPISPNMRSPPRRVMTIDEIGEPSASNASVASSSTYNFSATNTARTTPSFVGQPKLDLPRSPLGSPLLGDPALMIGSATLYLTMSHPFKIPLRYWSLPSGGSAFGGLLLVWVGAKENTAVEHYIPRDVYPYTKHKSLNEPLCVEFLGSHRIVYKVNGTAKLDVKVKAKYKFSDQEDWAKFQGSIRDKTLVDTFHFDRIKSKATPDLSSNESISLWSARYSDQTSSISFFINSGSKRHVEFPVRWFQREIKRDEKNRSIQIELVRRKQSNSDPPLESPRQRSSLFGMGKLSASPENRAQGRLAHRASVSSTSSFGSIIEEQPYPPPDMADKTRYLNIRFSTTEDVDSFIAGFKQAQGETPPSLSRISYLPPSSPQELGGYPLPPQEIDGFPIPLRPPDPIEL